MYGKHFVMVAFSHIQHHHVKTTLALRVPKGPSPTESPGDLKMWPKYAVT